MLFNKRLKEINERCNKKAMPKLVSGFTLIETLVAVSIFTISIVALLVVLTQGISNNNYAKKKILAAYLAQEGIEYMRNMRDTFVLYHPTDRQSGWNAFNTNVAGGIYPAGSTICVPSDGCYFGDLSDINYTDQTQPMAGIDLFPCSGTCSPLLYDAATGKHGYSGVNSGFIRKINVTPISVNETKISSTVYWTQGSGNYNLTFSENLYNWIE